MKGVGFVQPARRSASPMLAKVQIARKELGLDEDTYRAVLERLTGQRSAAGLDDRRLGLVLDEFKAKGWKPAVVPGGKSVSKAPRRQAASHPVAKKARALWISLHQLGVVENSSEQALEAFAFRQLGVERLDWAKQREGFRLIEALKAMAERAGWDQSGSLDEIKARHAALMEARRA
jgi:phage gp16-like protein